MRAGHQLNAVLLSLALLVSLSGIGSSQSQDERAVRAAYIFNLIKYVEWPPEKPEIVIGFLGNRATGEFLQKMLDGKKSNSKLIRVMLFPTDAEFQTCSILYVADLPASKLHSILDKVEDTNILTVGEVDSFAQEGGVIGLVKMGEQIRMQLNPDAVRRTGLKINPLLLHLAVTVTPGAANQKERKVTERHEPQYPTLAANMSLHGTVKLNVRIAPDGSVCAVEYVGGHPVLAQAAEDAVKIWKFEPAAKESGQIVKVEF
jgi:TonB family protein